MDGVDKENPNCDEPGIDELEVLTGYRFRDRGLLLRALTHSSFANESGNEEILDNERMEFLGDAVLGLVIADRVYNTRSDDEGGLTRLKSHLVSARTIYRIAGMLNLGSFLRLGRGEEQNGGRSKRSLVVDAFEALIAAIYLDGGIEPAAAFIEKAFEPAFNDIDSEQLLRQDYKSFLQEICQARELAPPDYTLVEESGPDHSKSFTVEVRLAGKALNRGQGKSKKSAEQAAARGTLEGIESGRIDLDTLAEDKGTLNHNGGDEFPSSTT